jgi:hypothetical protein
MLRSVLRSDQADQDDPQDDRHEAADGERLLPVLAIALAGIVHAPLGSFQPIVVIFVRVAHFAFPRLRAAVDRSSRVTRLSSMPFLTRNSTQCTSEQSQQMTLVRRGHPSIFRFLDELDEGSAA